MVSSAAAVVVTPAIADTTPGDGYQPCKANGQVMYNQTSGRFAIRYEPKAEWIIYDANGGLVGSSAGGGDVVGLSKQTAPDPTTRLKNADTINSLKGNPAVCVR
jgi:hypothetical protein